MRAHAQRSRMILGAAAAAFALTTGSALAAPGDVTLMSRQGSSGAAGDHASVQPFATADGLNVAFLSAATNLGPSPIATTGNQAYIRSLEENANQLASRANGFDGVPANAAADQVSVSDDGNMVAFHSKATNLPGNSAGNDAVFVRDLANGITSLVAANAADPSISGDGRYVAFMSHANYDGSPSGNVSAKIYVSDLQGEAGSYDLVSTDPDASTTTLVGQYPRLSADGRYVAFVGQTQVFVRDRVAMTTTVASRATGAAGAQEASGPISQYPGFSRDGRFVTWATASSLSGADTNGKADVYERDLQTNTTTLASRADGANGAVGDNVAQTTTVSDDGRYVGFLSRSTNFSDADNSGGDNAWVRDVVAGTLTWVHGTPDESGASAPQGLMQGVSLSGDGAAIFYDTNAHILPEDSASFADVFRRQLAAGAAPPPPPVLAVADAPAVAEGGPGGSAVATFTVTLSAPATQPVSVHYATSNGTATTDDYTPVAGTLAVDPGQTTATITVPITGDDAFEPDESFTLALDSPVNATLGRATATATIANDDPAPAPPPPPAPREHTLIGRILYRPTFAPGADSGSAKGLGISPWAKAPLRVRLVDAGGTAVRTADVTRPDPHATGPSVLDFELDGLEACHGCTAVLEGGAGAGDTVPVDFGGEAGQTTTELEAGREAAGGRVEGTVASSLSMSPAGFVVRVVSPGGKLLADSTKATLICGRPGAVKATGAAFGVACPGGTHFAYRLSGLPRDGSTVTVQLLQKGPKGDAVPADTQDVVLDPSGETAVPELEGLDVLPAHATGRVLFGTIAMLAPYAPGAVKAGELLPDPKERPEVALTKGGKLVKRATVTVSTGAPSKSGVRTAPGLTYSLDGLAACPAGCGLELRTAKTTSSFPVVVPDRTPSVTRADLRYPATGTSEFLEGEVSSLLRAGVRVKVTDAADGKLLADSGTIPDPTCGRPHCVPKASSTVLGTARYRLGGLPADRPVIVTLEASGKPVDSKAVTTAPTGQVTVVDTLTVPVGPARGHVVSGTVISARAAVPGVVAPVVDPRALRGVRLVSADGKVLATGTVARPSGKAAAAAATTTGRQATGAGTPPYVFQLNGVPACADCVVELVESRGAVSDRMAVSVPDATPSVTTAQLRDGELTAGKWVNVDVTPSVAVTPRELRVTVTGADGKLLADSAASKLCVSTRLCAAARSLAYRLGGVPADADTVTVTVYVSGKQAAADTVHFGPGSVEAASSLVVRVPARRLKG